MGWGKRPVAGFGNTGARGNLDTGSDPRHRIAHDQNVEGHDRAQIDSAKSVFGPYPGGKIDAAILLEDRDAKIQMAIVDSENQLGLGAGDEREKTDPVGRGDFGGARSSYRNR